VRVYTAAIPPGKQTLFHRHKENTCYVTLDDGHGCILECEDVQAGGGSVSPREQKQFKTGTPFFMMHRDKPYIHRLISPENNPGTVRFLGVEIKNRPALTVGRGRLRHACYDMIAENECARVYKWVFLCRGCTCLCLYAYVVLCYVYVRVCMCTICAHEPGHHVNA
jgi:hypothetical protein